VPLDGVADRDSGQRIERPSHRAASGPIPTSEAALVQPGEHGLSTQVGQPEQGVLQCASASDRQLAISWYGVGEAAGAPTAPPARSAHAGRGRSARPAAKAGGRTKHARMGRHPNRRFEVENAVGGRKSDEHGRRPARHAAVVR